jgi:hypothetical protein
MPTSRRIVCAGLLTALVAAGPVAHGADHPAETLFFRLDVLLTVAPALSESARASMMNEAAAIWRRQGMAIDWKAPTSAETITRNRLRALVVQKGLVQKSSHPIAVGELVRPPNGGAVAFVSIDSARQLLASVRGRAGYELIAVDQRRLGVVLGRALAHEIGHYVLDTHTHARSGLMRPHFDALEFTDHRDGAFALDHAAGAWLRTRDVERFAY